MLDNVLQAREVPRRPKGPRVWCAGSNMKRHACGTRDLPSCFDGGELVVFRVRIRIRIRLGSATERGGSSCQDSQLREDLGQRVGLTQTTHQTKTGT